MGMARQGEGHGVRAALDAQYLLFNEQALGARRQQRRRLGDAGRTDTPFDQRGRIGDPGHGRQLFRSEKRRLPAVPSRQVDQSRFVRLDRYASQRIDTSPRVPMSSQEYLQTVFKSLE